MSGLTGLPFVWAQAASAAPVNSLAPLALRRWYTSATLSSPGAVPTFSGLWAWLLGLAGLLLLAIWFQGPARALRQLLNVPALLRLIVSSAERIRRSGRVVAVTIGMTVVAWTTGQVRTFNVERGREDLVALTKSRSLVELSLEQGALAGLTPFRDVFSLGDNFPLLLLATVVIFRASADQWGSPYLHPSVRRSRRSRWGNIVWASGAAYLLYKLVALAAGMSDLPVGSCLTAEVIVLPLLMTLVDGALLAWVLVELRNASVGDTGNDVLDTEEVLGLLPGTSLVCLVGLPARYVATLILLGWSYVPTSANATVAARFVRWQLSWGITDLQAAALAMAGLAGVVAWSRGTIRGAFSGYRRLLTAEGGHLAAAMILAGLAAGSLSALAYLVVLALPVQTWVLAAADGYAHYATLPIGLMTLAAVVELGERSLPAATVASEPASVASSVDGMPHEREAILHPHLPSSRQSS